MARARNIKPGFFQNPELVELRYEVRLLFIGLWTLADREGRLEDRPKKIKMELFPADDIDIDAAISELHANGFVLRYEVNNNKIIQIVNFSKHQKPHHQEKQSELPPPPISEQLRTKVSVNPSDSLIPDTLNTDSIKTPSSPGGDDHDRGDSETPDDQENTDPPDHQKTPPCPHREIIDLYNAILPELQAVIPDRWEGTTRAKHLAARWRESPKHQTLAFWQRFFEYLKNYPWYLGENDRGWKANLAWMLERRNFDNLLEKFRSEPPLRAVK